MYSRPNPCRSKDVSGRAHASPDAFKRGSFSRKFTWSLLEFSAAKHAKAASPPSTLTDRNAYVQGMANQGEPNLHGPPLALDLTLLKKDEEFLLNDLEAFLNQAKLDRLEGGPVTVMTESGALEDVAHTVGALQANERMDEDMFFIVDVAFTWRKLRCWTQLFPRVKPFFAVKCNPDPLLVAVLAASPGCGFDCASIAEMKLVLSNGVSPRRIIFANPCKTPEAFAFALSAGVCTMTFDGHEELHKIKREYAALSARAGTQGKPPLPEPQLILRVRVPDSHSDVPLGEKYGANVEACADLIDTVVSLSLRLVGVSFHCGSGCHSSEAYQQAVRLAREVFDLAAERGIELRVLDIGGGFPGYDGSEPIYHKDGTQNEGNGNAKEDEELPLSCEAIARDLVPLINELFPPDSGVQVMSEPGRYFVEGSHVLFTQVYSRRWVDANNTPIPPPVGIEPANGGTSPSKQAATLPEGCRVLYFVGEGVLGCFKDALLCNETFNPHVLRRRAIEAASNSAAPATYPSHGAANVPGDEDGEAEARYPSSLLGPSGESFDVLVNDATLPTLCAGEWVYFVRMGAYTSSIASASSAVHTPGTRHAFAYIATRQKDA